MIKIQTFDRKIWRKDLLFAYMQQCANNNQLATIDIRPEGNCAEALGLYRLLDEFCNVSKYKKDNITIYTGNMIESHPHYNIVRSSESWYEVVQIKQWLANKIINSGITPDYHFANFSSRSNWSRLWLATILSKWYPDKTLQTYHYDLQKENCNFNGYIGVDELFKFGCNLIPDAVQFLQTCPRTLDIEHLTDLNNAAKSIYQHENSYYPIQHPNNLNLLQYYKNIFVDVVSETTLSGNAFFVTEKTWRAIVARRPFIIMSNSGFLINMRRLGFKTFHDYWDEYYDEYSGAKRILEIEQRLKTISAWDKSILSNKLVEMKDILDHNYQTFMSLTHQQIQEMFNG
jgi:hypothetical protein